MSSNDMYEVGPGILSRAALLNELEAVFVQAERWQRIWWLLRVAHAFVVRLRLAGD